MGDFGFAEEGVEGLHRLMILLLLVACFLPFARCCTAGVVFDG